MHQPTLLPIAKQGEAILQQQALPITRADLLSQNTQNLMDDMLATMLAANGVGIAAPQVFVSKRIIIAASRPNPRYPDAPQMEPVVMVNPELVWQSAETCLGEEGCLSVPEQRGAVARSETLQVRYWNRAGEVVEATYSGFVARIIQHEYDHLEGVLFVDRLTAHSNQQD